MKMDPSFQLKLDMAKNKLEAYTHVIQMWYSTDEATVYTLNNG